MNLNQFLSSDEDRAWIKEPHINVYVRKTFHYISKNKYPFLDLANVGVKEKFRGKGIFKAFLKQFENEAKKSNRGVYVESIQEIRLEEFLKKNGYKYVLGTPEAFPSMYKLFT